MTTRIIKASIPFFPKTAAYYIAVHPFYKQLVKCIKEPLYLQLFIILFLASESRFKHIPEGYKPIHDLLLPRLPTPVPPYITQYSLLCRAEYNYQRQNHYLNTDNPGVHPAAHRDRLFMNLFRIISCIIGRFNGYAVFLMLVR